MINKRQAGFTIIELLISLTIFSLIIVIVYNSFYLGIKAWRKNEKDLNACQMIDYSFNRIRKDFGRIANPASLDAGGVLFGSKDALSFFILSPSLDKTEGLLEIKKVKYFLENKKLMRQIVSYESGRDVSGHTIGKGISELTEDIKEIKFSYKSPDGEWLDQWTNRKFPPGVKINLQLDDKISGKINNFTREFFIPITGDE